MFIYLPVQTAQLLVFGLVFINFITVLGFCILVVGYTSKSEEKKNEKN